MYTLLSKNQCLFSVVFVCSKAYPTRSRTAAKLTQYFPKTLPTTVPKTVPQTSRRSESRAR